MAVLFSKADSVCRLEAWEGDRFKTNLYGGIITTSSIVISVVVFIGVVSVACLAYPMRGARKCEGVMGRREEGRQEGRGRRVGTVVKELSMSMVRLAFTVMRFFGVHRLTVLAGLVVAKMGLDSRDNTECVHACVWTLTFLCYLGATRHSSAA